MGTQQIINKEVGNTTSFKKLFYEELPYFLSIGMTIEQYFNDVPQLTQVYRKAHQLKLDTQNNQAWYMGRYIYEVIFNFLPILANGYGKVEDIQPYRDKPLPITKEQMEQQIEQENKDKQQRMLEHFKSLAK